MLPPKAIEDVGYNTKEKVLFRNQLKLGQCFKYTGGMGLRYCSDLSIIISNSYPVGLPPGWGWSEAESGYSDSPVELIPHWNERKKLYRSEMREGQCFKYTSGEGYRIWGDTSIILTTTKPIDLPREWAHGYPHIPSKFAACEVELVPHYKIDIKVAPSEAKEYLYDGLTSSQCLERYKVFMRDDKRVYTLVRLTGEREYIGTIAGSTYLTATQLEEARQQWSMKLKQANKKSEEIDRTQVVVDWGGFYDD